MREYPKSKFAEGLGQHSGIVGLMDDLGEALTLSRDRLIMMGGGNPAHIPEMQTLWRERMREFLEQNPDEFDRVLADYDQPAGNPDFRKGVADFLSRELGWKVGMENVAVTNGGQTAFFFLLNRLAGTMPDGSVKRVLLPIVPEYIGYGDQSADGTPLFDARKPEFELIGEREFKYHIDFDRLNPTDEHAAIVVSRPTNPSSNVLTDRELRKISELAKERNIPLIIDNAYGVPFPAVIFEDATPLWDEHIILTMSLSKLGLPGTRTGIVVANESIIRDISAMTAIVGLANNNVGQAIVRPLLENGEIGRICHDLVQPFYRDRSAEVVEFVKSTFPKDVPWRMHRSEGAFFIWFWFPELPISSKEFYETLKQRNVIVVPGEYFFFGLPDEDKDWEHRHQCIRVSFTQPIETIKKGLTVIGEALKEISEA